eukprot:3932348-Rhodomonas_salina.1
MRYDMVWYGDRVWSGTEVGNDPSISGTKIVYGAIICGTTKRYGTTICSTQIQYDPSMCGTQKGYGTTRLGGCVQGSMLLLPYTHAMQCPVLTSRMRLRAGYAVSGTDLAYAATDLAYGAQVDISSNGIREGALCVQELAL